MKITSIPSTAAISHVQTLGDAARMTLLDFPANHQVAFQTGNPTRFFWVFLGFFLGRGLSAAVGSQADRLLGAD